MGVTGLPGGMPDGDVTGAGDKGDDVGQKKWHGEMESMGAMDSEKEFSRRESNPKELRDPGRSPEESGMVILRPKLERLKLE